MARYNPPTTSALGVIQARNAALEEANREANRAIGTQPFQAVRKLTRQVAELTELTQKLSDVIDAMPVTVAAEAVGSNWRPQANTNATSVKVDWPEGKTKANIVGMFTGKYQLDLATPQSDLPRWWLRTDANSQFGGSVAAVAEMSTYTVSGSGATTITRPSGQKSFTVGVYPTLGPHAQTANTWNEMRLGVMVVFSK